MGLLNENYDDKEKNDDHNYNDNEYEIIFFYKEKQT